RDDLPDQSSRGTGDRKQDFINGIVFENFSHRIAFAQHRNAVNTLTNFIRVVIDKTQRLVLIQSTMISYVSNDHLSGIPRPINQNLCSLTDMPHCMIKATRQTQPAHKKNEEQRIDDKNR